MTPVDFSPERPVDGCLHTAHLGIHSVGCTEVAIALRTCSVADPAVSGIKRSRRLQQIAPKMTRGSLETGCNAFATQEVSKRMLNLNSGMEGLLIAVAAVSVATWFSTMRRRLWRDCTSLWYDNEARLTKHGLSVSSSTMRSGLAYIFSAAA